MKRMYAVTSKSELHHHAWHSELMTLSVFFRTAYGILDYYLTLGLKHVIIYL